MQRCEGLRRRLRWLERCWRASRKLAPPVLAMVLLAVFALPALTSVPVSASATIVSPNGWGWQNPLPQGNSLVGVWGDSHNDIFVGGDAGSILYYGDSTWSPINSGTTKALS